MGAELFFSERGHAEMSKIAKAICADCQVRSQCLEYGLHELFGIWGGLAPKSRRRVSALRRTDASSTGTGPTGTGPADEDAA
jgi:hypothetical protein